MLFDLANLSYWILLGIGVLLFLVVIVSGVGDGDVEIDAEADVDGSDFGSLEVLGWLGIGKSPLVLLLAIDLSTWGTVGWMLNVWLGSLTGSIPERFLGLGGVVLLISLSISLTIGSLLARPLGQIFASFGEDTGSDRLIGCTGTVTSKQLPYYGEGKIGQADILDSARNLVTVSVSLPSWATVVPSRGQQIVAIERQPDCYLVIAKNSADEDTWLDNSQ